MSRGCGVRRSKVGQGKSQKVCGHRRAKGSSVPPWHEPGTQQGRQLQDQGTRRYRTVPISGHRILGLATLFLLYTPGHSARSALGGQSLVNSLPKLKFKNKKSTTRAPSTPPFLVLRVMSETLGAVPPDLPKEGCAF